MLRNGYVYSEFHCIGAAVDERGRDHRQNYGVPLSWPRRRAIIIVTASTLLADWSTAWRFHTHVAMPPHCRASILASTARSMRQLTWRNSHEQPESAVGDGSGASERAKIHVPNPHTQRTCSSTPLHSTPLTAARRLPGTPFTTPCIALRACGNRAKVRVRQRRHPGERKVTWPSRRGTQR